MIVSGLKALGTPSTILPVMDSTTNGSAVTGGFMSAVQARKEREKAAQVFSF